MTHLFIDPDYHRERRGCLIGRMCCVEMTAGAYNEIRAHRYILASHVHSNAANRVFLHHHLDKIYARQCVLFVNIVLIDPYVFPDCKEALGYFFLRFINFAEMMAPDAEFGG